MVITNQGLTNLFCKTLLLVMALGLTQSCKTLAKQSDSGVVVARRAQIRSSTAVVAADLLEVNRGDTVDILDFQDVQDPSDNSKKSAGCACRLTMKTAPRAGLRRATSCPTSVLQSAKKLSEEDKGIPAQASGTAAGQFKSATQSRSCWERKHNDAAR